jgi:hypothetical protein
MNLTDNEFGDLKMLFTDLVCCSTSTTTINYEGNNWNGERCFDVDDFTDSAVGTADLVLDIDGWYYDDWREYYNMADFGDSLNTNVVMDVYCNIARAAFNIGGAYPGAVTSARVMHGDETPTVTATASYNFSTDRWETSFSAVTYTNDDFAYKIVATMCDSTRVGPNKQKVFIPLSEFADSIDTNPVTNAVLCDTASVEFYVGSLGDAPSSEVTAIARYGDDAASGNTATAAYDAATKRWKAKFYVGGFTDGGFYWRPEASMCTASAVGDSIFKHFRPGWNCP